MINTHSSISKERGSLAGGKPHPLAGAEKW
jgi:hypothetical protein